MTDIQNANFRVFLPGTIMCFNAWQLEADPSKTLVEPLNL